MVILLRFLILRSTRRGSGAGFHVQRDAKSHVPPWLLQSFLCYGHADGARVSLRIQHWPLG